MDVLGTIVTVVTVVTALVSTGVGVAGLIGRSATRASARFWLEAAAILGPGSDQRRSTEVAYLVAMSRLTAIARFPVTMPYCLLAVTAIANLWGVIFVLLTVPEDPSLTQMDEPAFVTVAALLLVPMLAGFELWLLHRRESQHRFLGFPQTAGAPRLVSSIVAWTAIDSMLLIGSAVFSGLAVRKTLNAISTGLQLNYWDGADTIEHGIAVGCLIAFAGLSLARWAESRSELLRLGQASSVRITTTSARKERRPRSPARAVGKRKPSR